MKKLIVLTVLCIAFSSPIVTLANYDDDQSSYIFYLEEKAGVLAQDKNAKWPYDVIPEGHVSTKESGDYYGEVVSGKKVTLTRFWFDRPTALLAGEDRGLLEIRAPYFANADHVTFFTAGGKPLFSISVAAASFCNDNGACNKEVGENSRNCPNDCPPIPGEVLQSTPPPTPPPPSETPEPLPAPEKAAPTIERVVPSTNNGTVTRGETTDTNPPSTAIPLTIGVFLIILAIVGWFVWRKMRVPEGFN